MKIKFYQSKDWLYKHFVLNNESIDHIADQCGVSPNTIRTALKKYDFIKK